LLLWNKERNKSNSFCYGCKAFNTLITRCSSHYYNTPHVWIHQWAVSEMKSLRDVIAMACIQRWLCKIYFTDCARLQILDETYC
jgi:hypothetical protein